jgi:spore germination protein YaaH
MKIVVTSLVFIGILFAQDHPSIHQVQSEYYKTHPEMIGTTVSQNPFMKRGDLEKSAAPNKIVYGFHPYWQNGSESHYYFNLLTHIAYFDGDVDPTTGNFSSTHSWATANVVTAAKNNGVKVHFSVVLFSNHAALLGSVSNKNNLIKNIMTEVNRRNADGVNIDFESISSSQAAAYRDFLKQLGDTLKTYNKEFVVELFAVDWNSIFPSEFFSTLNPVVDYYFIMLYDYYYSGSSTAGPVSPLRATTASGYHVLKSIQSYLSIGCPAEKLIAGFPNYGYDWPVTGSERMAAATGKGTARTFSVIKNNYIDTVDAFNRYVDGVYNVPWYSYLSSGSWRQTWYDDSLSWAKKFDSIKVKNIAGTGMWALGYDGVETDLWGAIKNAFTLPTTISSAKNIPDIFALEQNFPNPFNPTTVIRYQLPSASHVTLKVFDVLGNEVATLAHGIFSEGGHTVSFDASKISSGVYFYFIQTENFSDVKKMVVIK